MSPPAQPLSFDLAHAMSHLSSADEKLAELILATKKFQKDLDLAQSPYEALMESIAYQSISGKAAATIFGRVKALGDNGRPPTPEKMLKLKTQALRKAGLSAAKVPAIKDFTAKTISGVVPARDQAEKLFDDELVQRLVSVRGIGA